MAGSMAYAADPLGVDSSQRRPAPRLGAPRPHPRCSRGCPGLPCRRARCSSRYGLVVVLVGRPGRPRLQLHRASCRAWRWALVAMVVPCGRFDYRRLSNFTTAAPRRQRGAHPLCPTFRASAPTRAWAPSPGSRSACRCSPASSRRSRSCCCDASRHGPLPAARWTTAREYCKALGHACSFRSRAIMTQPDLGTGLVYLVISARGARHGRRAAEATCSSRSSPASRPSSAVFAVDELLKYQQSDGTWEYKLLEELPAQPPARVPEPRGATLRATATTSQQAQIAIGSRAACSARASCNATQSTHGFLPEAPTDFIFCVLAEELGFLGVMALHRPVRRRSFWYASRIARRVRRPVRHAHRHVRRGHVAVPDSGEHRHGPAGSCPSRASRCRS